MSKLSVETGNGKVEVSAKPAEGGPGLAIIHAPEGQAAPDSVTIWPPISQYSNILYPICPISLAPSFSKARNSGRL